MNVKRLMIYLMMVVVASGYMMTMTGCSDATSPATPTNENGFGVNATVEVSDEIDMTEANEVRVLVRQNADDSIAVEAEEVIAIVLRNLGDAEVLGLHLDYDRDELNYECVVRKNGKVYVIVVDPGTGEVKEQKEVDEYYYTGTIVINVDVVKVRRACDRAREIVDGDVVEANLEEVEGEPTYIIIILTPDNRYVTLYLDARTGKEKKLKDEKRCKNDDNDSIDVGNGDDVHSGECDRHKNKKGRGHYRHGKGKGYGHYFHCHCDCECDDNGNGGGDSVTVIVKDSARVILGDWFSDSAEIGEIELEKEDSTAFYVTVVEEGDDRYEVTMDAETGAFVSVTQTDGDVENGEFEPPTVDGVTLVTLSEARLAALAELTGTIQTWTLERNKAEGRWVYVFTVEETATTTVKTVRVDAETGLFIEII